MSNNSLRIIALAVLACGVIAGCSSSATSSSTSAAPAIAKSDWLTKANAICKAASSESNSQLAAAVGNLGPSPSTDKIDQVVAKTMSPLIQSTITQLRGLGYPPGDTAKLEAIYHAMEIDVQKLRANPHIVGTNPFGPQTRALKDYGATECGKYA